MGPEEELLRRLERYTVAETRPDVAHRRTLAHADYFGCRNSRDRRAGYNEFEYIRVAELTTTD